MSKDLIDLNGAEAERAKQFMRLRIRCQELDMSPDNDVCDIERFLLMNKDEQNVVIDHYSDFKSRELFADITKMNNGEECYQGGYIVHKIPNGWMWMTHDQELDVITTSAFIPFKL